MDWENYIKGLSVVAVVFGLILLFLSLATSPESGILTVVAYLFSVFIFVMCTIAMAGFLIRRWWNHNEIIFENIKISLRQGFLVSGLIVSLLTMSALRVLNWIDGIILVIVFLFLEMYFKTRG